MFAWYFDSILLRILLYFLSLSCLCAASIMDKKRNVQPCKHTEDSQCCSLWYYSAFSLGVCLFCFVFLTLQPWFTLAVIWQPQQVAVTPLGMQHNVGVAGCLSKVVPPTPFPPQKRSHHSMTSRNPAERSQKLDRNANCIHRFPSFLP